jgi:PKD repeat protein
VTLPLIFDTPLKTNGAISSSFTQKPLTNQPVFTFEFDPATSSTETPTVIDRFDWDFGDGSTQSEVIGAKVQHTYKDPGAYTIKLKVTNDSNNTATSSQTLTASSTGDLGQLEVKLTGASLETRSLTSFKVTIPASTEPRTIDVRYSSTHPIAAMREQCVTETNFNLVRASPSGDCGILLQPTENFTFTYTTVSPIYPQTIRPEATFGAYNDPITIRATTNTGKYSKLEAVIEVPAMPKLKTDGSSFNFPCSEVVDGQTVTPQRLYQFAIPNDWFAFEVNPILYTVYSMGLPNTDLPGQFFFSDPDDNGGGLTNTSRIHQPALGGGGTGVFLVNCKDKVSNSLQVNIVGPSGTLTLGQEASLNPSARGDFYVGVTPANPPLVGTTDSILAVGISGDHLAPQPRGNFFTNLTLASSKRLFGLQGGSTDFTAVLQTSIKSQPEPFAVWLQRSNASGTGTAQVVVDVPKPAQALETNQTVSSGISVGSLPALYTVSAPSGSWVILKNNEDLLVQSLLGTWKIARPSIRDGYSGSWSAAISDGSSQTMQVGAFIAQKQQLTIPFGTSFDTRLETAKKNVANGETVTGTLGFCDHIPGFGSPSTLECAHLYTFDATSGQKLNIGITNNADADYIILDSDAQVVKACNRFSIGVGQCVNTDIPLTKTGKYALVLQATIAKASNYSFTLNLSNP